MEKYELVKDIGSGNFGVARLMRDKGTGELVAMKYIPRGQKINENVAREIINQRSLCHPNIIRFKEVVVVQVSALLANPSNCLCLSFHLSVSRPKNGSFLRVLTVI
ncbi:hypothetical protein GW17_00025983 [Ensete ventricosum]|uniref:non-specific serine/threonine protein kinase n=1 Tax=Ensete ventricosum TaxID=4639 RepID=A0A444EJ92_ENSVE|nr:hypothetical protein B296_00049510 [Ensete ventricosum]RWW10468.1 hypothetical protein GW17_00025983 [Ensete ventricosum]RZR83223.1 hypothetical protein BHM03_00009812 [Ensete ventricosum]